MRLITEQMKTTLKYLSAFIFALTIIGCGGDEKKEPKKVTIQSQAREKKEVKKEVSTKASETVDLTNKGIGPIKSLSLPDEIDQVMVTKGADVYKRMCTACHRPDKKFIGPAPKGITERRTPEWIMNMILNPEEMVAKDPLAKKLLIEFNGSPMANQNLTEEEARQVLEYFRTLK